MSEARKIDPGFWESESIARLTMRQRLLSIGIFSNADDQGRMGAYPAFVRSKVFPYDEIHVSEIADDLREIENTGYIKQYEDNGIPVLQVLNWKHPRFALPSKYAPPEGHTDKIGAIDKGNRHGSAYAIWRRQVLRRDNYTCQICSRIGMITHHIIRWADSVSGRFDVDNGMTVCPDCHKELHGLS